MSVSEDSTDAPQPAASRAARVVWLTDIHLNFVKMPQADAFLEEVRAQSPDSVLIGGDIGEAHDVADWLARIDDALEVPVYFVLGNHDFYFGSIRRVRELVQRLCLGRPRLHYLTREGCFELAPGVGLVGHDGWADARIGNYERSMVMMNDYKLVEELSGVSKLARWPLLHALGDEAAGHIRRVLPEALERYAHVFLLTHVPPLHEACWHEGHLSDDEWSPHFTCKAMGDAILEIMQSRPDRQLTVLCGHTHGDGETRPLENVHVITGGAQYGRPEIKRVFELPPGAV